MANENEKKKRKPLVTVAKILYGLALAGMFLAGGFGVVSPTLVSLFLVFIGANALGFVVTRIPAVKRFLGKVLKAIVNAPVKLFKLIFSKKKTKDRGEPNPKDESEENKQISVEEWLKKNPQPKDSALDKYADEKINELSTKGMKFNDAAKEQLRTYIKTKVNDFYNNIKTNEKINKDYKLDKYILGGTNTEQYRKVIEKTNMFFEAFKGEGVDSNIQKLIQDKNTSPASFEETLEGRKRDANLKKDVDGLKGTMEKINEKYSIIIDGLNTVENVKTTMSGLIEWKTEVDEILKNSNVDNKIKNEVKNQIKVVEGKFVNFVTEQFKDISSKVKGLEGKIESNSKIEELINDLKSLRSSFVELKNVAVTSIELNLTEKKVKDDLEMIVTKRINNITENISVKAAEIVLKEIENKGVKINAAKSKQVAAIISQELIKNETFIAQISSGVTVENVVNLLISNPDFKNSLSTDIDYNELAGKVADLLKVQPKNIRGK